MPTNSGGGRDKLTRVFRYLEHSSSIAIRPKRQIREQLWNLWLARLLIIRPSSEAGSNPGQSKVAAQESQNGETGGASFVL